MADDTEAFRAFVDTRSRALQRAAWLLTGDWAAAEDLAQTALVETWRHWSEIHEPDAAYAYAHTVMVRTFLRWRRRRWTGEVPTFPLPDLPVAAEATDTRQALLDVIRQLPARQRAVVTLRYLSDLSETQVAEVLQCRVGTVRSHTAKALARLREQPDLIELRTEGWT